MLDPKPAPQDKLKEALDLKIDAMTQSMINQGASLLAILDIIKEVFVALVFTAAILEECGKFEVEFKVENARKIVPGTLFRLRLVRSTRNIIVTFYPDASGKLKHAVVGFENGTKAEDKTVGPDAASIVEAVVTLVQPLKKAED